MPAVPFDPSAVAGLVLDLDGTLIDSYEAIAESANRARSAFGLDRLPADVIRRRVGRGLETLIADLVGPERADEGVQIFRETYAEAWPSGTRILPGAADTLRALRARGYRMAVASNKPARFARPILERFGLADLFDAVEGPDSSGATKPDPVMMRRCLGAIGCDPSRALYVGDMVLDVETADRAAVPVILVAGGSSSRISLEATGRTVLDTISDLVGLLPSPAPRGRPSFGASTTRHLPGGGNPGYKTHSGFEGDPMTEGP